VYRHANAGQAYPIADTAISRDHSIALATVACKTPELSLVGITQNVRTRLINLAKANSRLRQRLGLPVCPDRAVDSLPEHLRGGAGRGAGPSSSARHKPTPSRNWARKRSREHARCGCPGVGCLDELLGKLNVVADATPKKVASANFEKCKAAGVKSVFRGGEMQSLTGHSFVA
jgi:hypothetical protein